MLEGCTYKYSKADFNNINVINVDIKSTKENLLEGNSICDKLNIQMVPNDAFAMQEGLKIADKYLTEKNINSDWLLCFQHDVIPLTETFWDDLQDLIDTIDNDKVGMIGGNCIMNYKNALYALDKADKDIYHTSKLGKPRTGRGMLCKDILNDPYYGWYMNLPDEYYKSKYFAVESPYWTFFAINRKLFNKYINVDTNFVFELWPDDLAYQFLLNGIVNIASPKLLVCHDHALKGGIKINSGKLVEPRHDFNSSHMRFWKKWGFRWGIRNPEVRSQFEVYNEHFYPKTALQHNFFRDISISNGPLDIDLKSKAPSL